MRSAQNFYHPVAIFLISILLFAISLPCWAQSSGRFNIAVLDMTMSGGIPDSYQRTLSDRLRAELFNTGRFTVIERNAMEDILGEQGFQMSGCTSDECAVEVGRLLGVERMIAGSVGRVGQIHSITVRMIDVETGAILDIRNVDCQCPIEEVLSTQLRNAARLIAGLDSSSPMASGASEGLTGQGDVYIRSNPDGARVSIDDTPRSGETPLVVENLPAGMHSIRLEKDNLVGSGTVFVQPGEIARVDIELELGQASLRIYSNPFEAQVEVDGRVIGPTPQTLSEIAAGSHVIRITYPGYLDHEETVNVRSGEQKRVEVNMLRGGALTITSEPEGAEIFFNQTNHGTTPVTITGILPGNYTINATYPQYRSWTRTISVAEGSVQTVNAILEQKTGNIRIESTELVSENVDRQVIRGRPAISRATITFNGESKETSLPFLFENLEFGEYSITVTAPDHDAYQTTVQINAEQTYQVNAELRAHEGILDFSRIPAGTHVTLISPNYHYTDLGVAPIERMGVIVGNYGINLSRERYQPGGYQTVTVETNQVAFAEFELLPKSYGESVFQSVICPGWGQFYMERPNAGWGFVFGEAVTLGFFGYSVIQYNGKVSDYHDAREAYNQADTPDRIIETYEAAESAYDDAESAQNLVYVAGGMVGVIYLWNVLDAILFNGVDDVGNPDVSSAQEQYRLSLTPVSTREGRAVVGITLGISF